MKKINFSKFKVIGITAIFVISLCVIGSQKIQSSELTATATSISDPTGYRYADAKLCNYKQGDGTIVVSGCDLDEYDFYQRECVSYVAYRINKDHGSTAKPYFLQNYMFSSNSSDRLSSGGNWDNIFTKFNAYRVDNKPVKGSIAVWNPGYNGAGSVGHVAYVENITTGIVTVSDYNADGQHNYSIRSLASDRLPSTYITIASEVGGLLKDSAGNLITNGAYLTLTETVDDNILELETIVDHVGHYVFKGVPAGKVYITAQANGNSIAINNINVGYFESRLINLSLTNQCIDGSGLSPEVQATTCELPTQNLCPANHNGLYCGNTLGLESNKLYNCQNGIKTLAQVCTNGCSKQPQGTNDFCASGTYISTCPNGQNGLYCGASLGLDQNTLYNCQNGIKTASQTCSLGCIQKPPGTADVCRTSINGGSCPSGGNGDYCGTTLGLDSNTLYTCTNGSISIKQQCSNGCQFKPSGTPDICYPVGSGGGGSTGAKVTLYGNANYDTSSIRVQVGTGDTEAPDRGSWYKSLAIPSGWSVILSDQHLGLVGNTQCFSQSVANLENYGGWPTSIESMKVYSTNVCPAGNNDWVKICKVTGWYADHESECLLVTQDIPNLGAQGFGDNTLKAINIGGDWEAVFFEHPNYGGARYQTNSSSSDLGGIPLGYGTSSIQVRRRNPSAMTLYRGGDFNDGNPFTTDRTITNLAYWNDGQENWGDKAQSMTVVPGYEVVVCTDAGFHGICGRTKNNVADLNSLANGLRGQVSSVQVCKDSCPPTSSVPAIITPLNDESFLPTTPVVFSWAGNGEEYYLEYWGGDLGNGVIQNSGGITGVSAWTKTNLPASTNPYYWHVRSWTSSGDTAWSPTFSFKVQDITPAVTYINGSNQVVIGTDQTFTALVSPSDAANLSYTWSPAPKSGQGTNSVIYNWSNGGSQTITVTVQNTGGSSIAQTTVNVGCPAGQYLGEYYDNNNLIGKSSFSKCEQDLNFNWNTGGPTPTNLPNLTVAAGQTQYLDNERKALTLTAASGQKVITLSDTTGYSQGDEILIIQMRGTGTGVYEYGTIDSISGNTITLIQNLTNTYTIDTNSKAQIVKVAHYQDVTISGLLTAHPWDGSTGGIVIFKAFGITTVNGSIDVTGAGFRKGAGNKGPSQGFNGEGINGPSIQSTSPNGNGGGGGNGRYQLGADYHYASGAGGGGNKNAGSYGNSFNDPVHGNGGSIGGSASGDMTLSTIALGGAGGEGGGNQDINNSGSDGGNGGGIIIINTDTLNLVGNLISNGIPGGAANLTNDALLGGGGGGAGGTILVHAKVANIGTNLINANAGAGGANNSQGQSGGGNGSVGRIKVEYCNSATGSNNNANILQVNCNQDNFSARWTQTKSFTSGRYQFKTYADDGVKVWVDSTLVIDKWIDGYNETTGQIDLVAGDHTIKVEYYEHTGNASINLIITSTNNPPIVTQIPSQTITAVQAFTNINLNTYGSDPDIGDSITWSYSGNTTIVVSISNNVATLTRPKSWTGKENITFKATDTKSASASSTATFTVNKVDTLVIPAPWISLPMDENTGNTIANTGSVGGSLTKIASPTWSSNIPGASGSSLDFATTNSSNVIESSSPITQLGGLTKFTITGWVNNKNYTTETGGNRIISWINNGGDGVDLTYRTDGSLSMSINQWNDNSPAKSNIYRISTDSNAGANNWRFIAVTYDSTLPSNQVKYYFGSKALAASFDVASTYSRGAVGTNVSNLAIGNLNTVSRAGSNNKMFKGIVDDFRVYNSVLSLAQIQAVQGDRCVDTFCVEYYNNVSIFGPTTYTTTESTVAHDWGAGGPGNGIRVDNFSARWIKKSYFNAGNYQFTMHSDDGIRVWVDEELIINDWVGHGWNTVNFNKTLTAGDHTVKIEYYEVGGSAAAFYSVQQL